MHVFKRLREHPIAPALILLILIFDLRYLVLPGNPPMLFSNIRSVFYVFLFAFWAVSLYWRIIHPRIRWYLIGTALLMVFWVIIRTIKWNLEEPAHVVRYLWYLFYLPLIFLPLFFLLSALSLGRPESFRLNGRIYILVILALLLLALVLTNDQHQQIFQFPDNSSIWTDDDYRYGLLYLPILIWQIACYSAAFLLMLHKCRVPGHQGLIWLPLVPLGFMLGYTVLYLLRPAWIGRLLNDITVTICLLVAATLEACIRSNLIQSNSHYRELFNLSSVHAQIIDKHGQILLSSNNCPPLSPKDLQQALTGALMLDERTRLVAAALKEGYVLWQEDVAEISAVVAELADKHEYLTSKKMTLHKEVETQRKEQRLIEKNRLYNELMNETADELKRYDEVLQQLEACRDVKQRRLLTIRLAVLCTYIKRLSNLLFLSEQDEQIDASELQLACKEWLACLRLGGVNCNALYQLEGLRMPFKDFVPLYYSFYNLLFFCLPGLRHLFLDCHHDDQRVVLRLNLNCDSDLRKLPLSKLQILEEDDNDWLLEISHTLEERLC